MLYVRRGDKLGPPVHTPRSQSGCSACAAQRFQGRERGRATGGGVERERGKDKEENLFKMQGEEPWEHFKLAQLPRSTPPVRVAG